MNKRLEQPIVSKIAKVVDEAKGLKTFIFDHNLGALPGQFVIVWIPGIDEKPFSVSYQNKNRFGLTVQKLGPFTGQMFRLKKGDRAGIRGPYGKGFTISGKKILLVGGGCGSAALAFLADESKKRGIRVDFIIGARSKDHVLYLNRMKLSGIRTHVATDDGSMGFKGYVTDLLEDFLKRERFDFVYSCGPEVMMKKVADICARFNVKCEVSLERYMKCGFGICGHCCLDGTGERVCVEGPVFSGKTISRINGFGIYKRGASGKKIMLGVKNDCAKL